MRDALKPVPHWLLCALGALFPFSVAATSVLLGSTLAVGLASGVWREGARQMWTSYRPLSVAMLAYWGLMLVGLSWSPDLGWGLHVIGHQWFWLAVPVLAAALGDARWRTHFLVALSIGLALHLGYCVLQRLGDVHLSFAGSNAEDATGFIGHIGFGFIYGIWAGWLLHWGWKQTDWRRWGAWLISAWAWVMIFDARGRGGYLVALTILIAVLCRHWMGVDWRNAVLPLALLAVMVGVLALGPGKARVVETWQEVLAIRHGDFQDSDPRLTLWIVAIDAWKRHPVLGMGTGGFPDATRAVKQAHPNLTFIGAQPGQIPVHPHSMYFQSLARWGLLGLGAFLALLVTWIRTGWTLAWDRSEAPLIALSGIALAVDGMFAPTMEQQGTGVMMVMVLGLALASGGKHKPISRYASLGVTPPI